jgi:hypothetical protein
VENFGMAEKDISFCFGMSKMTVVKESLNYKDYQTMKFVEFLEFIGRIADIKFRGSADASLPLNQKIEFVLDEILPAFSLKRKEVEQTVEENSESDEDY